MHVHSVTSCPGCGEADFAEVRFDGTLLQRCERCSLVSAREYADAESLYVDGYLTSGGRFGIDTTGDEFQRQLKWIGERRMALIERVVAPGTILDVGCGTGEVLAAAASRGWDAIGLELVEDSAEVTRSRGLEVICADLESSGLPEDTFDVVSLFHVLEHMNDAVSFLRLVRRWVRPGGHVVVEVPNFDSAARRRFGPQWMHLRPLEHVSHFTPLTMRTTMNRAGLEPVLIRSPSYVGRQQALTQVLTNLGRPHWTRLLSRFVRLADADPEGRRMTRSPVHLLLSAVDALDDRRGAGSVVFAVARRAR